MNIYRFPSGRAVRRGLSASDLLVSLAATGLLVAALVPVLAQARSGGGEAQSAANLQALAFANAIYAWDFNDRQWTAVPDDVAEHYVGGNPCTSYLASGHCPPPQILGWDTELAIWGYYLGCGEVSFGSCSNFIAYVPCTFSPNNVFGAFRFPNAKSFHDYVDGRFYSETWYAPLDYVIQESASKYLEVASEFTVLPPDGTGGLPQLWNSSYCFSPAAMWNPAVLSLNRKTGGYYTDPNLLLDGYASPSVSQAAYPDLKTRMIEHNWNGDPPAKVNPAFAGGFTPYFFNHGMAATPWTLFFDGHVAELPTSVAVADDGTVLSQTGGEAGLWSRDTPLGDNGYYGAQSYDGTLVSHHILTVDGILGRDILGTQGQANVAARHGLRFAPASHRPRERIAPPALPFLDSHVLGGQP